ncbi:MAG: DUF1304 domain-containing protein [Deltaproteobacteria bacterium]|nr:MAG: DUF1304 domain-containing protein [Deltaproteobacteria bacterium]
MKYLAPGLVGLIAALHVYIMVLEMFLWSRAVRVFGVPKDQRDNKLLQTMLKNQGLYNGFLAAGLIWGLAHPNSVIGFQVQLFFLACVAVAGLYGAATAQVRILFVQTIPAVIAGVVLYFL